MIAQDVYDALSGDYALTEVVGARIHPVLLPMGCSFPAICYRVSDLDTPTLSGLGARRGEALITIYSEGYLEAQQIADLVDSAMTGAADFAAVRDTTRDGYEPSPHLFIISLIYGVWIRPATYEAT